MRASSLRDIISPETNKVVLEGAELCYISVFSRHPQQWRFFTFDGSMFSCCLLFVNHRSPGSIARVRSIRDNLTCHPDNIVYGTVILKR